jgi:hypothetical protein
MTLAAPIGSAVSGPRLAVESLRGILLWLTGLAGGFAFIEPSPYEFLAIITALFFVLTGLSLPSALAPLVLVLVTINIGYAIAAVPVSDEPKIVNWVLISVFLAVTAIFYAAMLGTNTERRLRLLLRGYLAAALVSSLVAVAAYFRLFGNTSDLFLLWERARGTFNDPNVLGAFVVLPALLLLGRLLAGRLVVCSGLMLLIMLAALFLTFSRGAWAQFAFSGTLLMFLTFVTTRSVNERLRILFLTIGAMLAGVILLAALLSIEQVANLFQQRAALEQSYDVGAYGRFGRYLPGLAVALDHPLGIGPLQFSKFFTEDPHDSFLNAFMSGGWLAGFGYFALAAVTLSMGTRFLFTRTPWRAQYQAIYAAYAGIIAESLVIDIDHWRHYFLVLGVLWGLMAASRRTAQTSLAGAVVVRGMPA